MFVLKGQTFLGVHTRFGGITIYYTNGQRFEKLHEIFLDDHFTYKIFGPFYFSLIQNKKTPDQIKIDMKHFVDMNISNSTVLMLPFPDVLKSITMYKNKIYYQLASGNVVETIIFQNISKFLPRSSNSQKWKGIYFLSDVISKYGNTTIFQVFPFWNSMLVSLSNKVLIFKPTVEEDVVKPQE
eukprot:TRINITY_DN4013_c0_g1_i1.p1 TRINITY_DN4013_c0_g1~~TRINITY_DN4013_c0_g1_i1.p1  ORF type:complete len:183 (-),score=34.67 TRINITY_DN4013_c0_g1_i1:13-561(-)